jgi:ethanolamine utilization cobalamin adenosyltransferase
VTEDINNDKSSIYLTSNQQLPLFPANINNSSFTKSTPPTNVGQYEGNQIVLNSGRLVFNAKSDSILLLSSKAIQLSCGETLGVNAKQISLTAEKVYLGSSEGIEGSKIQSVVLGENLNFLLSDIAVFLQTLNIAFKTSIDSNGAPIVSLQAIACDAETLSNDILNIVNAKNLLSKTVKTI